MGDMNYISGIVKILENPVQKVFDKNITVTKFRVQLPQVRNNTFINLVFWGKLSQDVANYYQINDYIIIEGYLVFRKQEKNTNLKKMEITVLRVYPLLLNHNR